MSTVLLATLISCGPSASEKAALAKADSLKVADSLLTLSITKAVVDSTMKADSIAKIAVDTIKVVEVSAKK